jgi:WD40 repeat protein
MGQPTYFAAAVGVILDLPSNTQKHFGGGEVDTETKNRQNDLDNHNDDIECIAMSTDRHLAATGQRGPNAAIFIWDAVNGLKSTRIKVSQSKAIKAISFSYDTKFVACVDDSVNHKVHVFEVAGGKCVFSQNGDANVIYDIAFTN